MDKYPKSIERFFRNYTRLVYLAHTSDPKTMKLAEQAAETLGLRFEMRLVGSGEYTEFLAAYCDADARE